MGTSSQVRTILIAFWLVTGLVITSYYNACAKTVFKSTPESLKAEMQSTAIILINKDAEFTNNDLVELTLESHTADEVYVTNDSTCASGGNWEPLVNLKNWKLGEKNQQTSVYAKFRNKREGLETTCLDDAIIHDDQKPSVVLQRPSYATNEPAPIFNFVASDTLSGLDKSQCSWPGRQPAICMNSSSAGNIAEGRYIVPVKAWDLAGNVSDPVDQEIIVDRTKPVITLLSVPPVLGNNGAVSVAFNVTDDRSGVKSQDCSWDTNTNFQPCTSPLASNLPEGAHKIYIRASDNAGNQADVVSYDFTIDLTAPTVTITRSPDDFSNSRSATFEFEGVDGTNPITRFECRLDGQAYASCSSPKSYSGLSEGIHKFEVFGYDMAGNPSAPASKSWYVDVTPPTVTWVQVFPPLGNANSSVIKYAIADSGSGVLKAQCSLDNGAYQDCSLTQTAYAGLPDGNHSFKVKAYDKALNFKEASYSFIIDTMKPTISFTKVPSSPSNLTSFQFEFAAADANGIARVECKLDAQAFAPCNSVSTHLAQGIAEGARRFAIRAVDKAGNTSDEVAYDWNVDLTAPVISYFQMPPAAALSFNTVSLGFNVSDQLSGVKSVKCTLNGGNVACASGQTYSYTNLAAGTYNFVVTATDNAGNSVTDTKTWTITSPVAKTQIAEVKGNAKVDILVVIDNSGSMATEQANMGARFSNFLTQVKDLDWRIGIITTDVDAATGNRDGHLVQLKNQTGKYILDPSFGTQAQQIFSDTVQMGTNGSGAEWGLKASIRAIDRAFNTNELDTHNAALFRADAALAIIVVSDSLDDSGTKPEDVINRVKAAWPGQKTFTFHSIVVPESVYTTPNSGALNANDPCRNYREAAQYDGRIYHRLSDLTGGVKGTVCSEDYSTQLSAMGKVTADLVNSVTLQCQPVDSNGDGKVDAGDIAVNDQSGAPLSGYTLNGTTLTFSSGLPLGNNELKYYCIQ